MSRLRRWALSDSWFFITCRVLPSRGILTASEFACLGGVIHDYTGNLTDAPVSPSGLSTNAQSGNITDYLFKYGFRPGVPEQCEN